MTGVEYLWEWFMDDDGGGCRVEAFSATLDVKLVPMCSAQVYFNFVLDKRYES